MAWLYVIDLMLEPHSDPRDTRCRRLLFRATHRGTHENDLLLGGFVRAQMAMLDDADLTALEALLELPDPELADWLTGRQPIPDVLDESMQPGVGPMLRRIRAAVAR
jgi:antitoxin CptB